VERIKSIFESLDSNKNGYLEQEEMTSVFTQMDMGIDPSQIKKEVEKCISVIDVNQDNQITFEEFALWWLSG